MVREYSGGMIRRLEIAQSMLHRPWVLFLDEPSVGSIRWPAGPSGTISRNYAASLALPS